MTVSEKAPLFSAEGENRQLESEPRLEDVFVMIKPDAIRQGLEGQIFQYIRRLGLRVIEIKEVQLDRETIHKVWPNTPSLKEEGGIKKKRSLFSKKHSLALSNSAATPTAGISGR